MAAAVAVALAAPSVARGQRAPARPAGVTDQQIQQALQQRATPEMIRQRIQASGLTPSEVRDRLQSEGFDPGMLDAYLSDAPVSARAFPPATDLAAALAALGTGGLGNVAADTAVASRDSVLGARPALRGLRPFGAELFERATTQFQPLLTGPVDTDYRLGPGDQLVLILTGDVEKVHQVEVTREGFIVIPQVGQMWVSGLSLTQLTDVLYTRLGNVYSGVRRGSNASTHFQVSISRLRSNQVFVVGEVVRPGAYQVPSVATVFYALYLAGGPSASGSFREIAVRRAARVVRTLDVYDYLLRGDNGNDVRLESGDIVFVPVRSKQVSIDGNVVRPALYELKPSDGLRELVRLAGGVAPDAFVRRVQVDRILPPSQRTQPGVDRVVLDADVTAVSDSAARDFALEPNDAVSVFGVLAERRSYVTLTGNVRRPGRYQFTPGLHLWDVVQQAQGLDTDTYLDRALILRRQPDLTRRLVATTLASDAAGRPRANPELTDLDSVVVFARRDFRPDRTVTVSGAVRRPVTVPFVVGMTLRDAVLAAGGLRDDAYLVHAEVARLPADRAHGALADTVRVPLDSTYVVDRDSNPYIGPPGLPAPASGARDFPLEAFDQVFVLSQPEWELQRTVAIVGQVRFPGRYALLSRSDRLSDLVRRAGGLLETAYAQGSLLTRSATVLDSATTVARVVRDRVGTDLPRALRSPGQREDVLLVGGDSLFVPEYQPTVRVEGAVLSPVVVQYRAGRGVSYYVSGAGGFTRNADRKRAYVVQPSGNVQTSSGTPEPGSRVIVPTVPADEQKTNWAQVLSAVAGVLSSALTIVLVVQRL